MGRHKQVPSAHAAAPSGGVRLSFEPCWFAAPPERSHQYFPAFARASIAIQSALRLALAERFFADMEHFRDTRKSYPVLVYVSSRPFPGQPRMEFTYDILHRPIMRKFYYSVSHNLPTMLATVSVRLRAAGVADIAREYRPERAVTIVSTVNKLRICRRRMESLLVCETFLVNSLLMFAGCGALPDKMQRKIAEDCERVWLSRLRRLFSDCRDLAPPILAAATKAFKEELEKTIQVA